MAGDTNDDLIQMLDDVDANEIGDGGTSDAEGDGYECVISFKDGMKEVELELLCFDGNEIESGVEDDYNDAFVCEVKGDSVKSRLYGAPPGWSPLYALTDWTPTVNTNKGEPLFEDVDNPRGWSSYTFRPMFEPRGGKYICHAIPAGACPVPINAVMGKRKEGGYEFFYQGWKQENPTRVTCRFGATREDLFPTNRDIPLDVAFLKKMGLTKQWMLECNALLSYQLILPIIDPTMTGIDNDSRIGYYKDVARNTNMYAFGVKNRGGTCAEILGDPCDKKFPLPLIGMTSQQPVPPSIPSHQILGQSCLLNRISPPCICFRRVPLE